MSQIALINAVPAEKTERDVVDRAAAQYDAPEAESRLAAVLADAEIHREVFTLGQVAAAVARADVVLDELIAAQPYRRAGLESLRTLLQDHIGTCDPLSLRLCEEHALTLAAVDVPQPVAVVWQYLRRHRYVPEVDEDVEARAAGGAA